VLNRVGDILRIRASGRAISSIHSVNRRTSGDARELSILFVLVASFPVYPPTPSPSRLSVPEARCCPQSFQDVVVYATRDVRLTYTELTYLLNVLRKIVGPSVSVCASAVVIIAPGTAVLVETTVLGRIFATKYPCMVAQSGSAIELSRHK
jgi:hypothetical protein